MFECFECGADAAWTAGNLRLHEDGSPTCNDCYLYGDRTDPSGDPPDVMWEDLPSFEPFAFIEEIWRDGAKAQREKIAVAIEADQEWGVRALPSWVRKVPLAEPEPKP